MEIQVSGKNMDLGEALQSHVIERLSVGVQKYFDRGAEASVTFTKERHIIACDVTAHLASGVFLTAKSEAGDAYGAFDDSLSKLEKRIRRHKRRLKDHHANARTPLPASKAAYYLLEPLGDAEDDSAKENEPEAADAPVVVAESQTDIREMTVGDAVLQLDLADQPALVFKNAAHGGINVVYRRQDGHVGWVDPSR